MHGWSAGKYAVLRHEPNGKPSVPTGWTGTDSKPANYTAKPGQPVEFKG